MKCRHCGSENIRIIEEDEPIEIWRYILAVLLFPIGLLFIFCKGKRNVRYCMDCGRKEEI